MKKTSKKVLSATTSFLPRTRTTLHCLHRPFVMDPKEEQESEWEALQAIYMEDLREITDAAVDGDARRFTIHMVAIPGEDESVNRIAFDLEFQWPLQYPNEVPSIKLRPLRGMTIKQLETLQASLEAEAEQNLGMQMMFSIIQLAKDWIDDHNGDVGRPDDSAYVSVLKRDDDSGKPQDITLPKLEGTMVTVETFAEWKEKFDKERKPKASKGSTEVDKRLTGKEYFLMKAAQAAAKSAADGTDTGALLNEQLWKNEANLADLDFSDDEDEEGDDDDFESEEEEEHDAEEEDE